MRNRTRALNPKGINVLMRLVESLDGTDGRRRLGVVTAKGVGVVGGEQVPMLVDADKGGLRLVVAGLEEDAVRITWGRIGGIVVDGGAAAPRLGTSLATLCIKGFEAEIIAVPWTKGMQELATNRSTWTHLGKSTHRAETP